jgi:hypothetical protein
MSSLKDLRQASANVVPLFRADSARLIARIEKDCPACLSNILMEQQLHCTHFDAVFDNSTS